MSSLCPLFGDMDSFLWRTINLHWSVLKLKLVPPLEVGKVSYAVCILVCAPPLLLVATLGDDKKKYKKDMAEWLSNAGTYLKGKPRYDL